MKGVNDLYKEGKFKRFGLSNFTSYEVAEVVTIAKVKGYVLPTVYQGIYNAVERYVFITMSATNTPLIRATAASSPN